MLRFQTFPFSFLWGARLPQMLPYLPLFLGLMLAPWVFSTHFYEMYLTPKWLILYACTCCIILFSKKQVFYPYLGKSSALILWIVLLYQLIYLIFSHETYAIASILDRVAALVLIVYTYNIFRRHRTLVAALTYPVIGGAFLISLFSANVFGNLNMHAEFLGIAALFLIIHLKHTRENHWVVLLGLLFFLLLHLLLQNCRSVILSLLFCLMTMLLKDVLLAPSSLKKSGKLFSFFLSSVGVCFALNLSPLSAYFSLAKSSSIFERWEIWKGTLLLIKDHLLGVGPGMFDYSFLPYKAQTNFLPSESLIERSPHNEFLRYLSEDGVICTLLMAIFFLVQLQKRLSPLFLKSPQGDFIITYFVFIVIQSLFQFPLANPVPFFITSLMFGYFLAVTDPQEPQEKANCFSLHPGAQYLFLCCYALVALAQSYGSYLVAHQGNSYEKTLLAHRLDPTNAAFSFYAIKNTFQENRYEEAETLAYEELKKRPNHFPILFLLGYYTLLQGKKQEGCKHLRQYHKMFPESPTKALFIRCYCPENT